MAVSGTDMAALRLRLAERHIRLPGGGTDGNLTLAVNETWAHTTGAELARVFSAALG
jgi:hypothetical protein